jgi:hypothetical protein
MLNGSTVQPQNRAAKATVTKRAETPLFPIVATTVDPISATVPLKTHSLQKKASSDDSGVGRLVGFRRRFLLLGMRSLWTRRLTILLVGFGDAVPDASFGAY